MLKSGRQVQTTPIIHQADAVSEQTGIVSAGSEQDITKRTGTERNRMKMGRRTDGFYLVGKAKEIRTFLDLGGFRLRVQVAELDVETTKPPLFVHT